MTASPAPEGPSATPELDALFALVDRRYGSRLSPAEREGVRLALQSIIEGARALRAVRLSNDDEPFQPFVPFRSDP
jgi:hypothetical protein